MYAHMHLTTSILAVRHRAAVQDYNSCIRPSVCPQAGSYGALQSKAYFQPKQQPVHKATALIGEYLANVLSISLHICWTAK